EDTLHEVLAPKVSGAVVFGEGLREEPLDFLVFFSSAASFTDATGQANYAAASTFEDAYALELRRRCRFPVSVISWGYWASVGALSESAPGASSGDAIARCRAGFASLERLSPDLLARRLAELGPLPGLSGRARIADLAAHLGVLPDQQRLFAALVGMLEAA